MRGHMTLKYNYLSRINNTPYHDATHLSQVFTNQEHAPRPLERLRGLTAPGDGFMCGQDGFRGLTAPDDGIACG